VIVPGKLIESTSPENINLEEEISFMGIGFGYYNVPIDVVPLFLAGLYTKQYSILLVDEFQRFNNIPEEEIEIGLLNIRKALENLNSLYNFNPEVLIASDFMRSQGYKVVLKDIEERINNLNLNEKLLQTVPEKFRNRKNSTIYPLNEIACVEFLRSSRNFEVKIGPSKEKVYDEIMQDLSLDVSFAYTIDAYALGTKEPEIVIPYIPTSRGINMGQRIFLNEDIKKSEAKLMLGPEEANKYLLKIASISGFLLNKEYSTEEEINNLKGKRLKKITKRLVLDNIILPYKKEAGYVT